jgi:hypothetical protein
MSGFNISTVLFKAPTSHCPIFSVNDSGGEKSLCNYNVPGESYQEKPNCQKFPKHFSRDMYMDSMYVHNAPTLMCATM